MMKKNNSWVLPNSLDKFISKQWTRVKSSSSNKVKWMDNPDQVIEEGEEILPKKINYLSSDKSFYWCFKKDGFNAGKSRENLTNILKNYNEKVLKNIIAIVDEKQIKKHPCLNNKKKLVNYVTKIIVSKPKNHIRHCKCQIGHRRVSEVPEISSVEEPKIQKNNNKSSSGDTILSHKSTALKASAERVTTKIQTDSWNQIGSASNFPRNEPKNGKTVATQMSANETPLKIHEIGPSKKEAESIMSDVTVTEMTSSSVGKTSNKQNYFKMRNEPQTRRSTEPKPGHATIEYVHDSESRSQVKRGDCRTSPDSSTPIRVSSRSSQEESKLSYKDVTSKVDEKAKGLPRNAKGNTKSKDGIICNKCRRLKRGYDSGGRNNIIVSNYPQSHGTVLIKMQSKDTSLQFDKIMAELNHQKSEIKRLNVMYQEMVENNGLQKFPRSTTGLLSAIYEGEKRPNSIHQETSTESKQGHVSLFGDRPKASSDEDYYKEEVQISRLQLQDNCVDADIEVDTSEPQMKEAKRKFRSRVLVWLKNSWIKLKNRSEECRRNCNGKEARVYINQVFDFCQNTAMGTWNFLKKKFH
ncbi:uncharacterized protein [Euwallacea fornicatus]|uniref:uncharacterized protein isoform X2 n=1 Tax=Euwallacea fornicatus TaxID=995702 RepID=UPI00338F36D2